MTLISRILKKIWPSKIRYRLILGLVLIHLSAMTFFVLNIEKKQQKQLENRNHLANESMANSIAVNAGYFLQLRDNKGIEVIVKSIDNFQGIKYAMILSVDHIVLAHTDEKLVGTKIQGANSNLLKPINGIQKFSNVKDPSEDITVPILNTGSEIIGWVIVAEDKKKIYGETLPILKIGILYIVLIVIAVSLLALLIGNLLTRGINTLLKIIGEISTGNRKIRVANTGSFEMRALGLGINKMLDEIEEKNKQLENLNDNLPDSVVFQSVLDEKGRPVFVYLSNAIEKYFGKSVQEVMEDPMLFFNAIYKEDRKNYFLIREDAIRKNVDFKTEVRIVTFLGEIKWVNVHSTPRKLDNGKMVWDGIFTDITKQKSTEEALRKSEALFRSFVENANDTVFAITTEGILTYGSPNWTRVLGHDVNDFVGKSVFETIIHPDDIFGCITKMADAIRTGESQYGIEFRALHKDGSWRWQITNASPLFDDKHNVVSFIGMVRDVTEHKLAEEAMQNSAKSYFDLFNTITEAIYIQDENGIFIDVNDGVEKMYGYLREEVIGKTPEFLSAPCKNDLAHIQQLVSTTFTTGKSQQFEFWGLKKNGDVFAKDVICNKGRYFGKDVIITTARDITSHKLAEDALKESEEKFSKVFHLSPDVMLLSRISDGVIVDVNERAFALSGYQRSDVLGMTTMQLNGWADIEERNRYVAMLNRDGRVANFEKLLTTKSGEIKHTTISGEVIELKGEKFIFTVIHDITDRIKAEAEIKERAIQLQMLGDNLPGTVMYQITREINGSKKFTYLSKGVERITGKPVTEVVENPSVLFNLTDAGDLKLVREIEESSFLTMSAFQIDIRQQLITGEQRWYHIKQVPRKLADGRILWDGVQTDITEQKLADKKIRESEEKYRSLISQASDAIVIYSLNGKIHEFNNSAYLNSGYTQEEFEKLSIYDFTGDESIVIDKAATDKMKAGETILFVRNIIKKDGSVMNAEFNARMLDDNKVLAFIRDITERKVSEQKIKEVSQKYQQLFEKTPMPVWLYEVGTLNIIDVNEAAVLHYGYSKAEFLKMSIMDIRPDNAIDKLNSYFKYPAAGLKFAGVWKHKKKDGTTIDVEVNSHDFNFNEKKCRIVLVNDITKKLIVEKRLAESEIKYRTMIEHNQAGIYQTTLDGKILSCNKAFVKILGYESKEELLREDVNNIFFLNAQREEFLTRLKKKRELDNYEIKLKNKNGQAVYMIENCFLRKDLVSGEEIIEGTVIDISKRKKAEEALENSLREVSDYKYALDQSAIVSITDEDGKIKHVNENFCSLYGYKRDEVIGKNHGDLINSGYHPRSFWRKFWGQIQDGKVLKAEVCNKSKDGSLHWGDTTIVPFLRDSGKPYQYLAIRSDITIKRKLEKDLIEQQILQQKLITEMTIAAQEKERNELGKELHDNINQILATVKIYLGMAKVKNSMPENGINLIEQSYNYVNEAMEEIRKLSHSLVAPSLGDIGLQEALEELAMEVNLAGNLEVELKYEIDKSEMIDDKEELMLYRIVQEQISNIRKYAKAKKVLIKLNIENGYQYLSIMDDGVGFDTTKKAKGIGLKNIQSRVEFYSGNLEIISSPGKGCTLEINIPSKKNSK